MKVGWSAWLLLTLLIAGCSTAPAPVAPQAQAEPAAGRQAASQIAQNAASSTFAGLTVEEYALAEGSDLPQLRGPVGGTLPTLRERWRWETTATRVEAINKGLAPFGYRVTFVADPNVGHPTFTVYQGDTVVASDLDQISPPSVNNRGDDFLMLTEGAAHYQVLRRGKAETWDGPAHNFTGPVFAGDRQVAIVDEVGQGRSLAEPFSYSVVSGSEKLMSDRILYNQVDNPVKRLTAWEGRWVLEVGGRVIIEGEPLGANQGYTEVFGWQLLAGKPFYYAVKDGKTSIVYGDQAFPRQYDVVVHYRCCSPAVYNNEGNEHMAGFFGRRDGRWYYVEMGKYD